MIDGEKLSTELKALTHERLAEVFGTVMRRGNDDTERRDVMASFGEEYPELAAFIDDVSDAEHIGMFENLFGELEDVEADEFGPVAYGMLLGFLVLRQASNEASFNALFKS